LELEIWNFFMRFHLSQFWESFRVALGSLRSNKLRTALTLVGIVVGVSAVIAVVTIIKGLDQTVASTFSSQGSTVFTIAKKPLIITSREDFIKFNRRKDVTDEDAEAIARLCPACWRPHHRRDRELSDEQVLAAARPCSALGDCGRHRHLGLHRPDFRIVARVEGRAFRPD
jgi:hypothetical protein